MSILKELKNAVFELDEKFLLDLVKQFNIQNPKEEIIKIYRNGRQYFKYQDYIWKCDLEITDNKVTYVIKPVESIN